MSVVFCVSAEPFDASGTISVPHLDVREILQLLLDAWNERSLQVHSDSDRQYMVSAYTRPLAQNASGKGNAHAVSACRAARAFLAVCERRRLVFHWCPAHVGVAPNEDVDAKAKAAAADGPQPGTMSLAAAYSTYDHAASEKWAAELTNPAYRGHNLAM